MTRVKNTTRLPLPAICLHCGTAFEIPFRPGRQMKYCSELCRRAADQARTRAQYIPKPRHQKVWYDKTCMMCGQPFRTDIERIKCCSVSCGNRYGSRNRSAQSVLDRTRTCQQCGVSFVMGSANGQSYRGESRSGIFCSTECSGKGRRLYKDQREAKRAEHNRRRARDGLPSLKPLAESAVCVVCGSEYLPNTNTQKACSPECKRRYALDRERREAGRDLSPRSCKECGTEFAPSATEADHRRAFCSAACCIRFYNRFARPRYKHVRRARLMRVPYENVDPFKVFERDDWLCHICGLPAPRELRGTFDPLAPELDHVVPLARGGSHTYDNTACAHRQCNIDKGATVLTVGPEDAGF
jgi:HNH endonuclease